MKKLRGLGIVLLALLAVAALITFRPAYTPRIPGEDAVASLESVRLGGEQQWLLIRGASASLPLLLFLHGGPGMPAMYLAHRFQRPLEKEFLVVQWDRLGAGKSYRPGIPSSSLKVSRELSDARELVDLLRKRFHQDRVYLLGHSYGSYLGMLAVRAYPDLIAAYVGVGQVACSESREHEIQDRWLRDRAEAEGNQELIGTLGRPGFDRERWIFHYGGELMAARSMWPLLWAGLTAPEYSFRDAMNVKRGVNFTAKNLQYDVIRGELMDALTVVHVPVFFFTGRHDYTVPFEMTGQYFNRLQAPHKELVWFEYSAHFPFFEEPERFAAEMRRVKKRLVGKNGDT